MSYLFLYVGDVGVCEGEKVFLNYFSHTHTDMQHQHTEIRAANAISKCTVVSVVGARA